MCMHRYMHMYVKTEAIVYDMFSFKLKYKSIICKIMTCLGIIYALRCNTTKYDAYIEEHVLGICLRFFHL